jgi:hypothetical protein
MALEVISIGSDNLVRLDSLKNASTDAYLNTATVSFVLKDSSGATVQGSTAMANVNSTGRYEGTLTAANSGALTENAKYTVEITATQGGITLFRKLSCTAKYRSDK